MTEEVRVTAVRLDRPIVPIGACLNCRRSKLKCIVENDPPCNRCLKSLRNCEFPLFRRSGHPRSQFQQRPETLGHASTARPQQQDGVVATGSLNGIPLVDRDNGSDPNSKRPPVSIPIHSDPSMTIQHRIAIPAAVPPTAPPSAAVQGTSSVSNDKYFVENNQRNPAKRRRLGAYTLDSGDLGDELPSEQDMEQLFEIFQERLLRFIPIFGPEDFEDFSTLLEDQKPLVQCVCYVTARFLPGGNVIRDKLLKPISDLLLGISDVDPSSASHSLAILQGFIVLYAYAQAVPATDGRQSQSRHLLYWRVKTFTEAHAIQLFIHRAIEGLRAAIASGESHISSSYCYKMYTYWLWLYIMSHYGSIATKTPPSIRADASIREASKLLNKIGKTERIQRLLGEVELCLSWEQASIHETQLGEWWSQPQPKAIDDSVSRSSLDDTQAALNRWTQRWRDQPRSSLDLKAFHIRFVQFCITTYSIRPLKLRGEDDLLPSQIVAIAACVESASEVLTWALSLGPASKDRLRYFCDFGFVMISFCAFFILQTFQAFGPDVPQSDEYLGIVAEAAQLMIDLAIDPKHAPAVYGSSIRLLLEKVTNPETRDSQLDSNNLSQGSNVSRSLNWMMSDSQESANDPLSHVPDQTWDFTSLFPDMLWN